MRGFRALAVMLFVCTIVACGGSGGAQPKATATLPVPTASPTPTGKVVAVITYNGARPYWQPTKDSDYCQNFYAGVRFELKGEPITNDEGTWYPVYCDSGFGTGSGRAYFPADRVQPVYETQASPTSK